MITVNNLDVQFGKRILFQDVNEVYTGQLLRYHRS